MKHPGKTVAPSKVIALALTWDGARWPVGRLPPKARAFLAVSSGGVSIPTPQAASKLFRDEEVAEIRVCWVPRLRGGDGVLAEPFAPPAGKRIGYRAVKSVPMDGMLGVVYRRQQN